jgi:sugar phosphate isomerase/epimerase
MYHKAAIFLLVSTLGRVLKSPMRTQKIGILFALLVLSSSARAAPEIPASFRIGGWAIGCQAYSFNRFTAFEAIEKTAEAGGRVIEFYPGQQLRPDLPDVRLDAGLSPENIEALRAKLRRHDLLAVAFGVVDLPDDEAACRRVFDFARKLGIATLTAEPSPKALDVIERLVREYDINVAIHNHPRRENDPGYRLWDPAYVLSLVQNRDKRIGACADTGHWVRSGIRPVEALRLLRGRVISSHLKDLDVFSPGGHDVPFGAGVSDIPGILDALKRQGFRGNLSIEYEYDWEGSVPEIAQCIGFVRGLAAAGKR